MVQVRDFGAAGDGTQDDTEALQHALQEGDGTLHLTKGTYRITEPLVLDLTKLGFGSIQGDGGTSRIVMDGPGPAIRIIGNHEGTATPGSFKESTWKNERFPTVTGIEVLGAHKQADGIELYRTMQCTISAVLIRNCRHGIRLHERNRNFLLSHAHIYDNSDYGVFFDRCNLHQSIISACHISYNKRAGIKSLHGDVHNLHITGNDIEYNNLPGTEQPAADIWFEATEGKISEVSIASNTIQATITPNGANVRIQGADAEQAKMSPLISITGNVIGSQSRSIELENLQRVAISGNTIYNAADLSLHARNCHGVAFGSNTVIWRGDPGLPPQDGLYLEDCSNISLHGLVTERLCSGSNEAGAGINLVRCRESSIDNCQVLDPMHRGIELEDCRNCRVTNNTVIDRREERSMQHAIRIRRGKSNVVRQNLVGGAIQSNVESSENVGVVLDNHVAD